MGGPSDAAVPKLRKEPTLVTGWRGLTLAICPGAEYGPAKRWPVERFVAVAKHFIETRKAKVILLGAPVDMPLAEQFVRLLPEVENKVGKTTLAQFIAALVSARLVLCNDSGAMHLASALGVPTLAILRLDRAATDRSDGRAQPGPASSRAMQPLLPARVPDRLRVHE